MIMKKSPAAKLQPESDEEVLQAAGNLVWMSRKTLGEEEARNLAIEMKGKKKVLPEDGGEEKKYKKRRLRMEPPPPPPPPPPIKFSCPPVMYSFDGTILPRFPPNLESKVDPAACGFPFEKQLTGSDVEGTQQRRLFMIKKHVERWFLPLLIEGEEDVGAGIQVTAYSTRGDEYQMVFKRWAGRKYYVLNGGWTKFCEENKLEQIKDWVTVWMFRHRRSGKLCFAITWKRMNTDRLIHYKPHRH